MLFFFCPVLWNVYGECENFATLKGHTGAVMELHYNTDGRFVCLWIDAYVQYYDLAVDSVINNVQPCQRGWIVWPGPVLYQANMCMVGFQQEVT